jgi:hypothetical protein
MSHLTTPRLSNPTRCKCLLQTITSRGIILWVIILKLAVWQRHLIRHWVKYSWRWSQRIEEFTTITSLRIYGHIMLLYAPNARHPIFLALWEQSCFASRSVATLTTGRRSWGNYQWRANSTLISRAWFLGRNRLQAVQNLELYRPNMVRAYDKQVKQQIF